MSDFSFVADNAGLAESIASVAQCPVVMLDTEFMRTDTFYPIPALLQLSDGTSHYLIDPLAITDWAPLVALFRNPNVIKVLHSVSEDLEVFQRLLGALPRPLLDTQVGAALAGFGVGLGYQRLLDTLLGIAIDKDETRSNWLQRPLSDAQCQYAVLDVLHLMPAFEVIRDALEEQGRMSWWLEEGDRCIDRAEQQAPLEDYFRKIKSAWRLSPTDQLCLRALCIWRETVAREQDVPRGRIVKDAICIELAKRRPSHPGALSKIKGLTPSVIRRHGETLCDILAVDYRDDGQIPLEFPLNSAQKAKAKALRDAVDGLGDELAVPRELLMSKRDIEDSIRLERLAPGLDGWRSPILKPILNEVLSVND